MRYLIDTNIIVYMISEKGSVIINDPTLYWR